MDSIEEIMLLLAGVVILAVAMVYILPASTSTSQEFQSSAVSQIVLNSFTLASPEINATTNYASIYDNGFPTKLYVVVTEYNSTTNQPGPSSAGIYPFVSGLNEITLPASPTNSYYEIQLYDPSGRILYTTYYVYKYVNDYIQINNIFGNTKIYINKKLINPNTENNTAILSLPAGVYNVSIYTPYYFYSNTINFPLSTPLVISIPTQAQYATYKVYVDQMLPGNKLNILPNAVVSVNNKTATYKTGVGGNVTIKYFSGGLISLNITCPTTTCGTGITNNYTSLSGIYSTSVLSNPSTPFILYPKFRVIGNLLLACNGTTYPTPGTISIIASPKNASRNVYGSVNASGKFVTYLYAGIYNITGISLSGLFNGTQINVTHFNQTFNLVFQYCITHIPYNETIFYETGLPSNTLWSVTYGGAINQSTTNKITFTEINTKVNYTYSIPNVTINGYKYVPSPSSGASYTGKQINVKFTEYLPQVPITITNSQSSPTPAPFQEMITFNPSTYAQYENGNLGNIRFYQGSTELYSWCESGCSNTSSSAIFWVKLPNGVPATGNVVVNMTFEPKSVNYDGVYAGEASQLSTIYGQYDNIYNVMLPGLYYQIYYDSSGTCDNTGYQNNLYSAIIGSGTTITSCGTFVSSTNPFTTQQNGTTQNVDGSNQNYVILNYQNGYTGGSAYPNPPISNTGNSWLIKTLGWASLPNQKVTFYGMGDDGIALGYASSGGSSNGAYWLGGSSNPNNVYNGWKDQGATTYSGVINPGDYRVEQDYFENGGGSYTAFWTNVSVNYYHAAYPPNGYMPTTTFGSVVYGPA